MQAWWRSMTPDRAARAQRLGPYFEVQLQLARRMAELRNEPLIPTAAEADSGIPLSGEQ